MDTSALIAETNRDQAAEWDGVQGTYWAEHAQQYEASTAAHRKRLLEAAAIQPDSHVLDVGCGTGRATIEAAHRAPAGSAHGIDLSARMLDVARQAAHAEGLGNATFEQADAQVHPIDDARFDIVIGNTSAMFFGDKPAAFANLARALRPDGRLCLTSWQAPAANPWFVAFTTALAAGRELPAPPPDGPHPFSMADPHGVRPMLEQAGFVDVAFESIEEPMYFGSDAAAARDFMLGQFGRLLDGLNPTEQDEATTALHATLSEHETASGVRYPACQWLITARRPASAEHSNVGD